MSDKDPKPKDEAPLPPARHGYRNEVTWEGGSGRQPYTNQVGGAPSPGAAGDVEEGNRGERSGVTQEQFEQVKGTP